MQKLPKMYPQQFLLKSDDVVNSPKNHPKYLGYFCKKIVTKSFQKSANLVALEMNNRIVPIVKHVWNVSVEIFSIPNPQQLTYHLGRYCCSSPSN